MFIDAYATWCGPCKYMDKNVFSNAEVAAYYNKNFVSYKLDVDKEPPDKHFEGQGNNESLVANLVEVSGDEEPPDKPYEELSNIVCSSSLSDVDFMDEDKELPDKHFERQVNINSGSPSQI